MKNGFPTFNLGLDLQYWSFVSKPTIDRLRLKADVRDDKHGQLVLKCLKNTVYYGRSNFESTVCKAQLSMIVGSFSSFHMPLLSAVEPGK